MPLLDNEVLIVKAGTISGTNKGTNSPITTTEAYSSYGGSSDLWGLSWTYSDINDSTFGVAFKVLTGGISGEVSHYLKATNFGFSIPSGEVIDGILAEIKWVGAGYTTSTATISVNHVRITVYYSTGVATANPAFLMFLDW